MKAKCDCLPEEHKCPEGEKLWREYMAAEVAFRRERTNGAFEEMRIAWRRYDAHVNPPCPSIMSPSGLSVYIDDTDGDDANDGLTKDRAVKTPARAVGRLREREKALFE